MLFVYVVSCMHGRFDPVLLGISSGCFGVVVTLSATQKCRAILSQVCIKVYNYTKIWCVQVHLLSSSCSSHTCSCSLIWQRNRVDQRPICTAHLYGQKLFFWFIRDVVIIFHFQAFPLSQFFLGQRFFVCERFFPLGIVGRIPYNCVQSGTQLCFHWPILLILAVAISFFSICGLLFRCSWLYCVLSFSALSVTRYPIILIKIGGCMVWHACSGIR